jgi:YVTN family beta-propeller protein
MARRRTAAATLAAALLLAMAGCSAGQLPRGTTASGGSTGVAAPSRTGSAGSSGPQQHRVGDTLAEIQLTGEPNYLAAGFGSVWVSAAQDTGQLLVRIDPETNKIVTSIPVGSGGGAIAVAAGSIWVVSYDDGTLTRVDPATNEVLATIPVGSQPWEVTVDAGMIWVRNSDATLARVDPVAGRRVQVVEVAAGGHSQVAAGNGSVWTVVQDGLVRLDSATGRILASVTIPACCFGDLMVTPDLVWVADGERSMVYAVDPATNRVVRQFPSERGGGLAMADGDLWTAHGDTGLVTWRSPETGRTLGSAQLRGAVAEMLVTDDSVWVNAMDRSMVVRLATG